MDADLDSKEAEERSTHDDRLMLLPERGRTTHAPRIHNRGLGGLTIREAKKKRSTTTPRMRGKCSQSEEELLMLLASTTEGWEV